MSINEIQDQIIEEFSMVDDWMDKYQMLIELGNSLEPLDEKYKTPQNIIEGCQSRVWLQADYNDGIIHFSGERCSDSQGSREPADPSAFRSHPRRDPQLRPLLHRADWTARAPLAYTQQRLAQHGEADEGICPCIQEHLNTATTQSLRERDLTSVSPMFLAHSQIIGRSDS